MRIIGSAGEREWIVRVTAEELANLQGFGSTYSQGYTSVAIGSDVQVGPLFKLASEALETHKAAINAAKLLRTTSDRFLQFFKATEK